MYLEDVVSEPRKNRSYHTQFQNEENDPAVAALDMGSEGSRFKSQKERQFS